MLVIDKTITEYRAFFSPYEHPDIFEAPRYKRKAMCLEIFASKFELVDPVVRGEWFGVNEIELLIHSYENETPELDWPEDNRIDIIGQNGNNGDHYDKL